MFITKERKIMIANIFLNRTSENIISKNFIQYLIQLENLKNLRNKDLISEEVYLKSKVQIKKRYISNL